MYPSLLIVRLFGFNNNNKLARIKQTSLKDRQEVSSQCMIRIFLETETRLKLAKLPDICSCDNETVNTGLNQYIPVRVTSRSPHCTTPRYSFMDKNKRSRNPFILINIKLASPANTKLQLPTFLSVNVRSLFFQS